MAYLCEWLGRQEKHLHPAALGQYNLVRIHPFDDSNGRGARLLMKCLLMRGGFPPAIIRPESCRRRNTFQKF